MRKIVAAIAAVSFSLPATAGIVTFEYTGTVNYLQEPAFNTGPGDASVTETSLIPGTVRVGDTFRGRFSFDTDAPQSFTGMPFTVDYGRYDAPVVPAATVRFERSGQVLKSDALMPLVQLSPGGGDFGPSPYVVIDPRFGASPQFRFGLALHEGASGALQGYALPTRFDLSAFGVREFNLTWYGDGVHSVALRGDLTSLENVSAVPEPASYALLAAGLAVLGASTLRQRRRV